MDLKEHIMDLNEFANVRPPGSPEEKAAASYMQEQFGNYGLEVGAVYYPIMKNYSWFYALNYFLYLLAVMVFPSQPLMAFFITVSATFFLRLDVYFWPIISRFFSLERYSQAIMGRKKAYEETRHTILITASMDSRKSEQLSGNFRSWILRLENISGFSRGLQLLLYFMGSIFTHFSMVFYVKLVWIATWPGAILLWLLFYFELRRWLNGSWDSTINDNDSSLAVLIGIAEHLMDTPLQHCDVVLAAIGGDRDAALGMHNILTSLYENRQKDMDIINLEAVGGGKLRMLGREGLSRSIPALEELLDLGELIAGNFEAEMLVTEGSARRTSAATARSRGYSALTITGLDRDGLPCDLAHISDWNEKLALIEEERLQSVKHFILQMIAKIDYQL